MINSGEIIDIFDNKLERALKIAEQVYTNSVQERSTLIDYMNTKEFKFGQVVRIVSQPAIAHVLGCTAKYGIIVGHRDIEKPLFKDPEKNAIWDGDRKERDTYRIHQDKRNPFIGTDAKYIQKIDSWDEVPEELKEYKMRIYVTSRKYVSHTIKTFI